MEINFYKTTHGNYPALEFIKILPPNHQKKIFNKMKRLENHGLQLSLRTKITKKIQGKRYKGIYELIIDYDKCFYRIFFSIAKNSYLFMHPFKKKSKKTPPKELETALNIKRNINRTYES